MACASRGETTPESDACGDQELILAVPPLVAARAQARPAFSAEHFQQLAPLVDGFSLMTYDYNAGRPGPNAPLPWVQANMDSLLSSGIRCCTSRSLQPLKRQAC